MNIRSRWLIKFVADKVIKACWPLPVSSVGLSDHVKIITNIKRGLYFGATIYSYLYISTLFVFFSFLSLSFFSLAFSVIILSYYLKVCLTIFWFIVFSFFLSSLFLSHSLNFSTYLLSLFSVFTLPLSYSLSYYQNLSGWLSVCPSLCISLSVYIPTCCMY